MTSRFGVSMSRRCTWSSRRWRSRCTTARRRRWAALPSNTSRSSARHRRRCWRSTPATRSSS